MDLDKATGRVHPAEFIPSPNCDRRPPGAAVEVLVVHCISLPPGQFGGPYIEHLFCNRLDPKGHEYFASICQLNVSAHFLIPRLGSLVQFVPTHLRAWHAGVSKFEGRSAVNDFSIGIELEGTDDSAFTDAQYDTLVALTRLLMNAYRAIRPSSLVGHSDIAPGRKTDPGTCFDWDRYLSGISSVVDAQDRGSSSML